MGMAAPLLLRGLPLLRVGFKQRSYSVGFLESVGRSSFCSAAHDLSQPQTQTQTQTHDNASSGTKSSAIWSAKDTTPNITRWDSPEYRQWKDRETEILEDIEPITFLTKEILHSDRYIDGERLSAEDEKAVVEKLLAHHPHSEDKIGCGLDSIMVDRHPQFRHSRCLFVVRTDGGWIDFSYQKCLRAYIRDKYPSYAERFIREHFKRGSG